MTQSHGDDAAKIQIQAVSKSFGRKVVLDHLDLHIRTGETMVIIGRSGSGKSVLLKLIVGLLRPEHGAVVVDGADVTKLTGRQLDKVRLKMGMLFQGAALFDSMTAFENVAFPLREHTTLSGAEITQRVHDCLHSVGLQNVDPLYPSELSGGMRKRVGLARAIANRPEIILYDEPTTGIDPIMGDVINNLIINLRDRMKVTSVMVTHDMVSATKVADRIAMLYNGKILEVGSPQEIRSSKNPILQQFIKGEAVGPIQEGLPQRQTLSRWAPRGRRHR